MQTIITLALDAHSPIDSDQLLRSPGLRLVSAVEIAQHFYLRDALVPQDGWESIADQIVELKNSAGPFEDHTTIGLFNASDEVKRVLANFMYSYRGAPPRHLIHGKEMDAIRTIVTDYLMQRFPHVGEINDFDKIKSNSPGLSTVTVDTKEGGFNGLHYDSWYGTSLRERLQRRHRICFNLGPVARWLLFIPLPLPTVYAALVQDHANLAWGEDTPIGDVRATLKKLNPPVHCLKLNPGQGYIAATESILHDATTRWSERTSFNIQIMSRFDWLPNHFYPPQVPEHATAEN